MSVERWPLILGSGLLLVVMVNLGFIWVAVTNAPTVERSYELDEDR